MPVTRPLASADRYIVGRLDVTTAADLRAELLKALESRPADDAASAPGNAPTRDFVVDISGVGAVDMVGVGLLVGIHRQAGRRARRLVLTGVPPHVMRLLIATRLRRVLAVVREPARPPAPSTRDLTSTGPVVLDPEAAFAV